MKVFGLTAQPLCLQYDLLRVPVVTVVAVVRGVAVVVVVALVKVVAVLVVVVVVAVVMVVKVVTVVKVVVKSELKRKLFEILEREDDYIRVSDITGQFSKL